MFLFQLKSLESDKNYSLKLLLKARSDCERIVVDFERLMRHYANNQTAQAEVVKGYRKWKTNIDTCTQYIEQAKVRRISQDFSSSDGQVKSASSSGSVDSGLIPSRIKPMTLKLLFTASLFGAQHNKNRVKNKPASVPLGKALSRIPPSWCNRQIAGNF